MSNLADLLRKDILLHEHIFIFCLLDASYEELPFIIGFFTEPPCRKTVDIDMTDCSIE